MSSLTNAKASVVLVHGGFVDGSGWEDVYRILKKDGYEVSIVQNPTTTLEADVAATRQVIASQRSPVILVGHSYGGVVITEAGNDPKVTGLVYIAAFAPDKGESVASLIKDPPPGAPVPPILPPPERLPGSWTERAFAESFAADVAPEKAQFMADSQVPWGLEALNGAVTTPAWKTKPSWYLVATQDHMIPPPAQHAMAKRAGASVAETPASHSLYVSKPRDVANLIEKAANAAVVTERVASRSPPADRGCRPWRGEYFMGSDRRDPGARMPARRILQPDRWVGRRRWR